MKTLTLLITFHNKTDKQLTRLLKSLDFENDEIEYIIVYKKIEKRTNSIIELYEKIGLVPLRIESGFKNKKIIEGTKIAKGKYVAVVDPDDIVVNKNIVNLVNYLKKNEKNDFFINSYYIGANKLRIITNVAKNQTTIFKRELLISNYSDINDRIVSQDLYFCNCLLLKSKNPKIINYPYYHYLTNEIVEGINMSTDSFAFDNLEVAIKEYNENIEQITRLLKNEKNKLKRRSVKKVLKVFKNKRKKLNRKKIWKEQ